MTKLMQHCREALSMAVALCDMVPMDDGASQELRESAASVKAYAEDVLNVIDDDRERSVGEN
jgi:hypothetical protein